MIRPQRGPPLLQHLLVNITRPFELPDRAIGEGQVVHHGERIRVVRRQIRASKLDRLLHQWDGFRVASNRAVLVAEIME